MSITSDIIRGHTDTIILSHLVKEDSYGYKINKTIYVKTQKQYELKEATLYSAFKRLEELSYITSYWGDDGPGARRKYYKITKLGIAYLTQSKEDWKEAKIIIDKLI